MKATKSVPECVRRIKRINALYKRLKDPDSPTAGKLRDLKDELMDEMVAACPHPSVIATRGDKKLSPSRICDACGHCETLLLQRSFRILGGRTVTYMSAESFRFHTGLLLKRLGINL